MPKIKPKIEKGVPLPRRIKGKYGFSKMAVGDSIYSTDRNIQQAALSYARRNGVKIVTRQYGNGWRVWRTA